MKDNLRKTKIILEINIGDYVKNILAILLLMTMTSTVFAADEGQVSVCAREIKASLFLDTARSILENELELTERKNPEARYQAHDLKVSLSSLDAAKEIAMEQLLECRKKHPGEF